MVNVGIIGCGFVDGALKDCLLIHVPTEDDGTQDLSLMRDLKNTFSR